MCHSLQLAVSAAATAFMPKQIDFIVSETYNWLARCGIRQNSYQKLYSLQIIQPCSMRWLLIAVSSEQNSPAILRIANKCTSTQLKRKKIALKVPKRTKIRLHLFYYAYSSISSKIEQDL